MKSPSVTDEAPSITAAPYAQLRIQSNGATDTSQLLVRTNTSRQVTARSSAANTTFGIVTLGWKDRRGRDG